jgi:hypothetical protein
MNLFPHKELVQMDKDSGRDLYDLTLRALEHNDIGLAIKHLGMLIAVDHAIAKTERYRKLQIGLIQIKSAVVRSSTGFISGSSNTDAFELENARLKKSIHSLAEDAAFALGLPSRVMENRFFEARVGTVETSNKKKSIFISYRRQDSIDITDRIYDRLMPIFGSTRIFKDTASIKYGTDFRDNINTALQSSTVAMIIIGPDWLKSLSNEGKRRIDNPDDLVRFEVETALRFCTQVLPVLVRGATMPNITDFPTSIAKLSALNAIPVRADPDFHRDVDRLIRAMKVN